jgi:hypothetical protein
MVARGYGVEIDITAALNVLKNAPNVIREEAANMAQEIAELGENEMKAIILTSGTDFSDKAREAGINAGPGRFRTGAMYKAVKSRVEAVGDSISASYGWIGRVRKYFKYQEYGFRNRFIASYTASGKLRTSGGQPIVFPNPFGGYKNTVGMFSLRDSAKSIDREAPRFLKKYRARITRRINRGES